MPDTIWNRTLDLVLEYAQFDSERLVLWSGVISATGDAVVRTIIAPVHEPLGARVRVEPETWRGVLEALKRQDQMLLAQVHSHPGAAFHSHGDDERPAEHSDGFISIVIPDYGEGVEDLADCAAFEYRIARPEGRFHELTADEISARIILEHEVVEAGPP